MWENKFFIFFGGPSFGFPLPGTEENVPDMSTGSGKQVSVCPNPDSVQCQVVVRDTPVQSEPRRDSIGPPPSYSFVMNEKRKGRVMVRQMKSFLYAVLHPFDFV